MGDVSFLSPLCFGDPKTLCSHFEPLAPWLGDTEPQPKVQDAVPFCRKIFYSQHHTQTQNCTRPFSNSSTSSSTTSASTSCNGRPMPTDVSVLCAITISGFTLISCAELLMFCFYFRDSVHESELPLLHGTCAAPVACSKRKTPHPCTPSSFMHDKTDWWVEYSTVAGTRGVLRELDFFLLRTAPRDRQPPTATNRQPPTDANCQRRPNANCQPLPTATNHQSPTTNRHQPPPTATNRQLPAANRQLPPTVVEHMSYTQSFCRTAVQEHYFFPPKDPPGQALILASRMYNQISPKRLCKGWRAALFIRRQQNPTCLWCCSTMLF